MKKFGPIITLFIILVLPLLIWLYLRTWTHRVKPIAIVSQQMQPNPEYPDSVVYKTVGDFTFISQLGDTITRQTFENKIWVADVFHTSSSTLGPQMAQGLQQVHDYYKDDPEVNFLSISVDPESDSLHSKPSTCSPHCQRGWQQYTSFASRTATYILAT